MGKQDNAIKIWLEDKARFADLFNAIIFDGQQIIKKEDLKQVNSESNVIIKDKEDNESWRQRFRDIIMEWQDECYFMVLAIEAQEKLQHAMPLRIMLYDVFSYDGQVREIFNELPDEQKKSKNPYTSFKRSDKLKPIITIVLYYGSSEWDTNLTLYDMFGIEDDEKEILSKYVPDYKINLINPSKMEDYSIFKSDLKVIFNMLKFKYDLPELRNYMNKEKDFFSVISEENIRAIKALFHSEEIDNLIENTIDSEKGKTAEKEAYNMRTGFDKAWDDALAQEVEKMIPDLTEGLRAKVEAEVKAKVEAEVKAEVKAEVEAEEREKSIKNTVSLLKKANVAENMIISLVATQYEIENEKVESYF